MRPATSGTVVFVLKGYPRLSETFIAQEILGLERAGLNIRIVAMRRPTDAKVHPIHREIAAPVSYLPEYLHEEPMRVIAAAFRALVRSGFGPAFLQFLRDLPRDFSRNRVRRFGQALVMAADMPRDTVALHAHFIHTPASVARYASLLTGLAFTCSSHAKDIWTSPEWDLRDKLAHARWTVTCTAAGQKRLNVLAPNDRQVQLVYHGFDRNRFPPLAMPRPRNNGGSAGQAVSILAVGRAVSKKGFDRLLQALALLPEGLYWTLTHIGGGEELAHLKRQGDDLELSHRISWLGAQAQEAVLDAYRRADLFVLPCRIADDGDRDGLPNVIVEAQSQSLCVISTNVSAIPELIDNEHTGLLVPPDDALALSEAIARLMADPELRIRLGKAGGMKVHAAFGHEEGIAELMALFTGMHATLPQAAPRLSPSPAE